MRHLLVAACAAALTAAASPLLVPAAPAVADDCTPQRGAPQAPKSWAQDRLNFPDIWPRTTGTGIRVAVVDTGLGTSPALAGIRTAAARNLTPGQPGAPTDPHDIRDCNGHGSAVAAIIAAPPVGGASFTGVAPGATIIPVKYTAGDTGTPAAMAAAIEYAVRQHANIVNVSSGSDRDTPALRAAVAQARSAGVLVVAAAGNSGANGSPADWPAAYAAQFDNVVAVSATDENDQVAAFATKGGYVDVAAPGQDIVYPAAESGYIVGGGTSYAAPFVAGTAALILAAHPGMTPAQVRARLEATADPPPVAVPSPRYGWGIVNPYLAVTANRVTFDPAPASSRRSAPLPAPRPAAPADHHLAHVALAGGAGLVGLAVIAIVGAAVLRRPAPAQQEE